MIEFNGYIIKKYEFKYENGIVFNIAYQVYFKNGKFFTTYFNETLEQVKKDLLQY